jgi:hypothetical protein
MRLSLSAVQHYRQQKQKQKHRQRLLHRETR